MNETDARIGRPVTAAHTTTTMKIVINALSARQGGGQTYLKNLLAHLPAEPGLEILVYAPTTLALPQDARIRRGTPTFPTENPLLRSVWEKLWLPRILRRERADLLFCPGGLISTPTPPGCRTVTMFRNMIPFDDRARRSVPFGLQRARNWLLKHLMLSSMARADLTIFISQFARGVIESLTPLRAAVTIPHGINARFRTQGQPLARPPRLPPGKVLLYVSKFDGYKHQFEVVQGYARLPRALQEEYTLVLVGETDHPDAQRVADLIPKLPRPDGVVVLGPVDYADLPAYYHHASAIVFASSCENCPNILLEGLASGRPMISSDVMPMPEFGGTGIEYFSPFDPDDIARALGRVLSDPQQAEKVAQAGLAESTRFDWTRTAERTWCLLMQLGSGQALGEADGHRAQPVPAQHA